MRLFLIALCAAGMPVALSAERAPLEYQPYCALPGTKPLFVSPMGEPFRAEPGAAYPSAAWFAGADRDGDGGVDRVEFVRDADRFFKTLDTNHDGRLTPEEIDVYERTIAPEIALYGPRGGAFDPPGGKVRSGESGYGGPMGAGRYAWLNIPEPVASADLDVNRTVDEKEFARSAGMRFDQLAKDARITLSTTPRTPQQMALEGKCQQRPAPRKLRKGEHPEDRDERQRIDDERRDGERPTP